MLLLIKHRKKILEDNLFIMSYLLLKHFFDLIKSSILAKYVVCAKETEITRK